VSESQMFLVNSKGDAWRQFASTQWQDQGKGWR